MTQLSRNAVLGMAKESTPGTYVVPSVYIPFTKAAVDDQYAPLKDESYRGNDSVLQGLYQGPGHASWDIDMLAYPDLQGHFLRSIIGPDTVTAGVSTTLSSGSSQGATTISTAASIAANSYVMIDTGANLEYAKVTAVSGSGPYSLTVTTSSTGSVGLAFAHASSVAVVSQTSHSFKQSPSAARPTYSFTLNDTVNTSTPIGWTYAACSDLQIKIDPKAIVSFNVKFMSFPGVAQSTITPTYTATAPMLGWQWNMTNAGGSSTRGLTYDVTLKRATEAIASSDGSINPREVFAGALEADGTYKAIFESMTDLNLYLNYTQQAATANLLQPISAGAQSLALTMSKSGWSTGKRDLSQPYVQADFSLSGIWNSTDGGIVQSTLLNFQSTAY